MALRDDVKLALHELGGKAIIEEIVEMLFLKKKIEKNDSSATTAVSRRLQAMKSWGEVDRYIYSDKKHPKTTLQDVWFIVEQKL